MTLPKRTPALAAFVAVSLALPQLCFAGAGAQALSNFITLHIINNGLVIFEGVAAFCLFYYGFRMILEAYKGDEAYTNAQNSFIYAAGGFIIIAISSAFVDAFFNQANGADPSRLVPGINSVSTFIITLMSGMFVLMITIDGLRMIASQGEASERTRIFKLLVMHCIGVAISLVAFAIVHAVADNDPGLLVEEMKGIILFLLTIFGTLCVVALIVAGVFLVISFDESLKDRAKKVVIGTLTALVFVLVCYTAIVTFV
jgi:hypothetical protein